jgi:DNA-binding response OmpR family regulator
MGKSKAEKQSKMRVVTVDDDASGVCTKAFKKVFEGHDWEHFRDVESINDHIKKVYSAAGGIPPDLFILDVQLKDSERAGIDVLANIRRKDKNVPVVMLSVSRAKTIICDSLKKGARVYLEKPASPKKLEALVKSLAEVWPTTRWCDDLKTVHRGSGRRSTY